MAFLAAPLQVVKCVWRRLIMRARSTEPLLMAPTLRSAVEANDVAQAKALLEAGAEDPEPDTLAHEATSVAMYEALHGAGLSLSTHTETRHSPLCQLLRGKTTMDPPQEMVAYLLNAGVQLLSPPQHCCIPLNKLLFYWADRTQQGGPKEEADLVAMFHLLMDAKVPVTYDDMQLSLCCYEPSLGYGKLLPLEVFQRVCEQVPRAWFFEEPAGCVAGLPHPFDSLYQRLQKPTVYVSQPHLLPEGLAEAIEQRQLAFHYILTGKKWAHLHESLPKASPPSAVPRF